MRFSVYFSNCFFVLFFSSIGLLCGSIIAYEMVIGDLGSMVFSQTFSITVEFVQNIVRDITDLV